MPQFSAKLRQNWGHLAPDLAESPANFFGWQFLDFQRTARVKRAILFPSRDSSHQR